MTKEEWQEYQDTVSLYVDSAQYEYRRDHPSCFYCECTKQENSFLNCITCRITTRQLHADWESDQRKAKRIAKFCKYYFPKTDLSS